MGPHAWSYEGDAGHTITMLVAREKKTKMVMSAAVPSKSTGRFVVDRVWAFMQELGIEAQDVVVKTDQEPAIKHLVDGTVLPAAVELRARPRPHQWWV